ncbi:hypothetical protein QBC38DRAFT_500763 [Podospora fimiseda]|uniref:Secreted protein n=1 Tax=Podospora fimiseda TaxID=252190 RepID=A0AAN7GWX0_9PEZI|nr:hypothetical protein QBC38DRAFT_500763 [Podospora fimiseda]
MHASAFFVQLAALAAIAHAAPAAELDIIEPENHNITARSGWRTANVYTGSFCSGQTLGSHINFGCGGSCHKVDGQIWSILLNQEGTGNPKPTASLFMGDNCSGQHVSAGIYKNQHSGCTNLNNPAKSYYLYWNC